MCVSTTVTRCSNSRCCSLSSRGAQTARTAPTHQCIGAPQRPMQGRRNTVRKGPRACFAGRQEVSARPVPYLLAKQASSMIHSSQKGALMYQGATTSPCSFLRRSSSSHTSVSFSLSCFSLSRICAARDSVCKQCVRQHADDAAFSTHYHRPAEQARPAGVSKRRGAWRQHPAMNSVTCKTLLCEAPTAHTACCCLSSFCPHLLALCIQLPILVLHCLWHLQRLQLRQQLVALQPAVQPCQTPHHTCAH